MNEIVLLQCLLPFVSLRHDSLCHSISQLLMFPLYFATYSSAVLDPVITKSLQCSYVSIFFLTPLLLPVSTAYLLQTVARLNTHINQAFNLWVQNVFYVPFILSLLLSSIPLKREGERDGDKAVIQRERRE